MYKPLLLPLLLLLLFISPVTAQENTAAEENAAAAPALKLEQEIDERFLALERRIYDQNELSLRRLEHVEERIATSRHYIDRILLIFGLCIMVVFLFIITNLRAQQKATTERIARALQDADNLMHDIQREIARPEMEHLRISQILRRQLRRLRSENAGTLHASHINDIREASNDPYLPVSLHFIAQVLVAEYDNNWNTAAQMLEHLREIEPADPDILLHLSHVHKNVATTAGDSKVRVRHERLAYQYYGQFTAAIELENHQLIAPQSPVKKIAGGKKPAAAKAAETKTAAKPPVVAAADKPPATPKAPSSSAADGKPPVSTKTAAAKPKDSAAPAGTAADNKLPAPAKAAETKPAPKPPVASATTTKPPVAGATSEAEQGQSAPGDTTSAATKTADTTPKDITTDKTPAPAKPADTQTTLIVKDKKAPMKQKISGALVQAKNIKSLPVKQTLASLKQSVRQQAASGTSMAISGISNLAAVFSEKDNAPLPFLPVPPTSPIPEQGSERSLSMWRDIQKGDLTMAKATTAKTIKARNRIIDAAIICYAQAQAHDTNETLYHNWGVALLAKALHVPEKKRTPFFNAAVDKFLAGNVVAPHYFDFHLASLYAIIGNVQECLKWLQTSRENGKLDVEALQQAPDFDSVRHEPWFDQFLEE